MATIKITIVGRYEGDDPSYGVEVTPKDIALMDQESYNNGEVDIVDLISWCEYRDITVIFEAE
jgi:hypothetical protein